MKRGLQGPAARLPLACDHGAVAVARLLQALHELRDLDLAHAVQHLILGVGEGPGVSTSRQKLVQQASGVSGRFRY